MKPKSAVALALASAIGGTIYYARRARTSGTVPVVPPAPVNNPPTAEQYMQRWRERLELPDSLETIATRTRLAERLRDMVRDWNDSDLYGAEGKGAQAVILMLDPTRYDHIALAITAHNLIRQQSIRDLTDEGQTHPDYGVALEILSDYLDNEGWHVAAAKDGTQWENDNDIRKIKALYSPTN